MLEENVEEEENDIFKKASAAQPAVALVRVL